MVTDRKRTILLVEDNPSDEFLTVQSLEANNILNEVITARDGAEALDFLFCTGDYEKLEPGLPQLVLLDLNLPKVSGLEVLKKIRGNERTKHLPVIIFTASEEEQDLINGYQLGANSYIRKPVDFIKFNEAIKLLGLYWLVLNDLPNF